MKFVFSFGILTTKTGLPLHSTVIISPGSNFERSTFTGAPAASALALGLNKGVRTKLKGKAPLVNLAGNNEVADRFQAYIIAVAVQEKGLDFLDRSNSEIREISEEYINTGLREMEKIFLKVLFI